MKNKVIIIGGTGVLMSVAEKLTQLQYKAVVIDSRPEEMRLLGLDEKTINKVLELGLNDDQYRCLLNLINAGIASKNLASSLDELSKTIKEIPFPKLSYDEPKSKYINKPKNNFKKR